MLDEQTKAAVLDALQRVLSGRERVPGDLPYPQSIPDYAVAMAWPDDTDEERQRRRWSAQGRNFSRAVMRIYVAGYFAGRAGDIQIGSQVRQALGLTAEDARDRHHPYVGLAVCLVCDQAPEHAVHHYSTGDVDG